MHLVMFDIDGTLVDSAGFDTALYAEAVRSVLDLEIDTDWSHYEHVSDSGILEQIMRQARITGDRVALAARVQRQFIGLVQAYLQRNSGAIREIRGATRLVERLRASRDVRVAIATGGWEPTARMKLERIGIATAGLGFASGSDACARTDIMRLAAQRASGTHAFRRASYFGDGAWDRRASAELGYDFVAVGDAVRHAVAFADLGETDAILRCLGVS
jgi:beta-phosphoglucomutase-like phosphatase (HAD superfamily)